jgi:hypothetical protein
MVSILNIPSSLANAALGTVHSIVCYSRTTYKTVLVDKSHDDSGPALFEI